MAASSTHLSARQAAERLEISPSTLYAYVSRGLLSSRPVAPGSRQRCYPVSEVEALVARRAARRDPSRAVATALGGGGPVLESAITLIVGGRLYYRGREISTLAGRRGFEEVAELLWLGRLPDGPSRLFGGPRPELPEGYRRAVAGRGLLAYERLQLLLPAVAIEDPAGLDRGRGALARHGARLLRRMLRAAAGGAAPDEELAAAELLAASWCPELRAAACLLDAALVATADHELNVSAFAARVVASAGASPSAVVTAGLAALGGVRHGGTTARAESFLGQLRRETGEAGEAVARALARRLARGEEIPGFGHPLYPDGDPRAALLLALLAERFGGVPVVSWVERVALEAGRLLGAAANLDFALAALSTALELPEGSALALFAVGRTAGWLAQAIEQVESGSLVRPRARYVGPLPDVAPTS